MVTKTRTLFLLPGLDGTEIFFRPLLAALPAWIDARVVTYPTAGANGYEDLLPIVERAVAGCAEFFLLGWSFSGPLALLVAAKEHERTRGVILSASFVRSPFPRLTWLRFATVTPVVFLLRLLRRMPVVFGRARDDPFRGDKAKTWARVPARVLAARARAILSVDARDALRAFSGRVLYLEGARDRLVDRRSRDEVVRTSPQTRVVTLEGPHLAMYMEPEAAARAIAEFMGAPAP